MAAEQSLPGVLASPADAAVWHVRVLGGFEMDDGRHRLTRLRSRAAMALVARLAMAPTRDHAREELATLLWPDADEATCRSRLRQTLSLLKAVLEPVGGAPVILADRRVLRAAPGALWCDATAFEQALRAGQRELAQALYGGELLPGFYDEWVVDERQRLQALADRVGELPVPAGSARPAAAPQEPSRQAPPRPVLPAPPRAPGQRLPTYLTRLIGADQHGARLRALVAEQRLVVALGAGGCGKTRLAIEVARSLADGAPGGPPPRFERAVFVSLVGAVSATELLDRLGLALRVQTTGDPMEPLLQVLDRRNVLLLLDNAEQLDADATARIAHLAERLPEAHWLITSRRPLGLDGERDFMLGTLALPAADAPVAEVALNPAVALFVDRARAHRPDFHVSAANRDALVALVRWLDGLPLAIELAASHTRTLGPADLLNLLQAARAEPRADAGSLGFLARRGARSGSDPRHASMLDVVAWSWQLLEPAQRRLLLALCLLPAGATLHAAAALGGSGGPGGPGTEAGGRLGLGAAQALLDDLVAQSVLRPGTGQDGQWRYLPLEPVREYALGSHGDEVLRPLRRRVLDMLLDWARAMPATPPLPSVRDELPNIMAALAAAPADGDADDALLLVLLLQSSWGEIAVPAGVLASLDCLLAAPGLDDSRAAGGHALAAVACQEAGRADDVRRHRAAALARPCPDTALRAMVLSRMARMYWRVDKDAVKARVLIDQAVPLARDAKRPNTEASLLSLQGHLATVVDGDAQRGKALSAQAAEIWARSGNRHLMNAGRYNVAVQTMEAGRSAEVLAEFEALAAEGRELQDWDLTAGAYEARGTALLRLRRWAESADSLRRSLHVAWEGLEMQAALYALWNLPPALARLRQAELAAETMGTAQAQWEQRFGRLDRRDMRDLKRIRRFTRALLGAEAAAAAWRRGSQRSVGDAVRHVFQQLPG